MAFPGGMDAVMERDKWSFLTAASIPTQPHIPMSPCSNMARTPITASHFQSAPIPAPRAWERVPVPVVVDHTRQRKIWKRVGGLSNNTLPNSYTATMMELESNGDIPRKRARPARYVPVFGDAKWDQRCNEPCDGKWDLIEARVSVSAAKEANAKTVWSSEGCEATSRYIPRKRHNSRWPIQPKTTPTRHLAELQPLIVFEVPKTAEPVEPVEHADEIKMGRRSTRRLSRRLSLFPGEESPRKLEPRSLSPEKASGPMLSPTKRTAVALSPTRVAESPRRLFSVDLPAKELLLASPATTLPAMSPCKSSPLPVVQQQDSIDACLSATVQSDQAEPTPLLFDQPIPAITVEPQHETRRRISLLSARHSDRRSSGFLRMVDFDSGREAPKRRHSFNPSQSATPDLKTRRSSLGVFFIVPDQAHGSTAADDNGDQDQEMVSQERPIEAHQEAPVAYEVDVGTNLDIFGQSRHLKAVKTFVKPATADLPPTLEPDLAVNNDVLPSSPANQDKSVAESASENVDDDVGVTSCGEAEAEVIDQAAASSSPGPDTMHIADGPDPMPGSNSSHLEDNSPCVELDTMQSGFEFGPHDPEGLSTIYEEESLADVNSPQKANMADAGITGDVAGINTKSPITATALSQVDDMFDRRVQDDADGTKDVAPSEPTQSIHHVEDAFSPSNHEQRASFDGQPADLNETISADDALSTAHSLEASSFEARSPSNSGTPVVIPENDPTPSSHHSDGMDTDEPQTSNIPVVHPTPIMYVEAPTSTPERPVTPEMAKVSEHSEVPMVSQEDTDSPDSPHSSESSGFTPINGRQISPVSTTPKKVELNNDEEDSADAEDAEADDLDQDEFMVVQEVTNVVDEDYTLNVVEAPKPENDTLTLARHDDADFVRDFVSRVAAGKSAKAAAAATVATEIPKKVGRPKRRSGSTGSATTCTGSPVSKSDTPKRSPLGERSLNTPSPLKREKRKLEDEEEDAARSKDDMNDAPEDAGDEPKLKRRRKRADPVLEETTDGPSEPDGTTGPRRSTRARSTRITLKSAGPSANSIAMSLYPVRLAGGVAGMIDDSVMDSHLTLSRQRSEAKSIEAITRGNTRANKAGAVLPQVVLARLAEDPSWKMKELKGVFDAKENRAAAANNGDVDSSDSSKKSKKAKGVRWDPELVRYQSDDSSSNKVIRTMAKSLLADIMKGDGADEEDELAAMPPVMSVSQQPPRDENSPPTTEKSHPAAPTPIKKPAAPLRRTRSSRLQAPTPVKKLAGGGVEKKSSSSFTTIISPPTVSGRPVRAATSSTKTSKASAATAAATKSIPTPKTSASSTKSAAAASSKQSGMATRRTKIASLGMGVNGTPAPKRRGRPAASAS